MKLFDSDDLTGMHEVFAWLQFIPLHCECRYDRGEVVMTGLSPNFSEASLEQYPPEYTVGVKPTESGVEYSLDTDRQ
jgi:hypothetical protein